MKDKKKARKLERQKQRKERLITLRKAERESARLARMLRPKGTTIRKSKVSPQEWLNNMILGEKK